MTHTLSSRVPKKFTVISVLVALIIIFAGKPAAAAECLIQQVEGETSKHFTMVQPGSIHEWTLGILNVTDDSVDTSIAFSGTGDLTNYLELNVDLCSTSWVETAPGSSTFTCPASTTQLLTNASVAGTNATTPTLAAGETWHARISAQLVSTPALPASLNGATGTVVSLVLANGLSGTVACPAATPTTPPPTPPSDDPDDKQGAPIPSATPGGGDSESASPSPQEPSRDSSDSGTAPGHTDRLSYTGTAALAFAATGVLLIIFGFIIRRIRLTTSES